MNIRLSDLKQAMVGQLNRNSVVANNLANVNSSGYKRDVMFSELLKTKDGMKVDQKMSTDFSQGDLSQTNNPLDMAISGEGFFTIDGGDEMLYTRDGHFSRGADGLLRTSSGLPVMGQTGWIDLGVGSLSSGEIQVNMNGDIHLDGEYLDTLEIVRFDRSDALRKMGGNLFQSDSKSIDHRVENPVVLQGKIEGSNVEAVHEMVQLIELQRSFETSQKALRTLDDAQGKAANNIGNYR